MLRVCVCYATTLSPTWAGTLRNSFVTHSHGFLHFGLLSFIFIWVSSLLSHSSVVLVYLVLLYCPSQATLPHSKQSLRELIGIEALVRVIFGFLGFWGTFACLFSFLLALLSPLFFFSSSWDGRWFTSFRVSGAKSIEDYAYFPRRVCPTA